MKPPHRAANTRARPYVRPKLIARASAPLEPPLPLEEVDVCAVPKPVLSGASPVVLVAPDCVAVAEAEVVEVVLRVTRLGSCAPHGFLVRHAD